MSRLGRWRHRRLLRRMAGPKLLAAFAEAHPQARFVEIGANDGEQHDHLRPYILDSGWRGVMAEPVPYVFARLQANYAGNERVSLVNAAVADRDGVRRFYHLRDAGPDERAQLPDWYDGVGSFSRAAVLSHAPDIPDVEERIVESEVEALSFDTLLERGALDAVDLVVVDTEGYDGELVRSIDLVRHRPRLLVYEHFHLAPDDRAATLRHVEAAGYRTMEEGFDTFCVLPGTGDALDAAWKRARPAVPGVAKTDEVPDLPLHDETMPLPYGAEERLRGDHPRLAELRAAYAALDVPVTTASRWSRERIDAFLDLCWFRGETLIMWHQRDADPAATRARYEEMLADAAARDDLGLLDRLEEDGEFGCWTFEIGGRHVSRDLLESVGELNFLERHLGLSGGTRGQAPCPTFAVLDIGAGYGRLAHRAATAFENCADWCCVDAVPESTFVAEYYLEHRGVVPPARVLGLHELGDLEPGAFDLAVNVHSFPEMPLAAVEWWVELLARLEVPYLFVVPNDGARLLSLEPDGDRHDIGPALSAAGYEEIAREDALQDVRLLFARG